MHAKTLLFGVIFLCLLVVGIGFAEPLGEECVEVEDMQTSAQEQADAEISEMPEPTVTPEQTIMPEPESTEEPESAEEPEVTAEPEPEQIENPEASTMPQPEPAENFEAPIAIVSETPLGKMGEAEIPTNEPECFLAYTPTALQFKKTRVSSNPQLVECDGDWEIRVMDTLEGGSDWKLYASAGELVSTDGEDSLSGMLVFIEGNTKKPLSNASQTLIATRPQNSGMGLISLTWAQDEGLQLFLNANAGIPGKRYETTITWRLDIGI